MKTYVTQEEAQVLFQLLQSKNCYYCGIHRADNKGEWYDMHSFSYLVNDTLVSMQFALQENTIKHYYVYFDGIQYKRYIRE